MSEILNQSDKLKLPNKDLSLNQLGSITYDIFRANSEQEISYKDFILRAQNITKILYTLGEKIHKQELPNTKESNLKNCAIELFQISANPLNFFLKQVVGDIFGETGRKFFEITDFVTMINNPNTPELLASLYEVTETNNNKNLKKVQVLAIK